MQAFNCEVPARRPRRVFAPDASLARETRLRLAGPRRVARPSVVGATGDARHPVERRWVSGRQYPGRDTTSSSIDNAEGGHDASGSR